MDFRNYFYPFDWTCFSEFCDLDFQINSTENIIKKMETYKYSELAAAGGHKKKKKTLKKKLFKKSYIVCAVLKKETKADVLDELLNEEVDVVFMTSGGGRSREKMTRRTLVDCFEERFAEYNPPETNPLGGEN